jgi:hypothetical protein
MQFLISSCIDAVKLPQKIWFNELPSGQTGTTEFERNQRLKLREGAVTESTPMAVFVLRMLRNSTLMEPRA